MVTSGLKLTVLKSIKTFIKREREFIFSPFLGKCINQLLFLRTGIVGALTNTLGFLHNTSYVNAID